MSDQFDRPRRDGEDDDARAFHGAERVQSALAGAGDGQDEGPARDDAIEAARENVLAGWPEPAPMASDVSPAEDEREPLVEQPAEPEGERDLEAPAEMPPLADHLSATMEHAPGELTVPPGFPVLEGEPRGERRSVGVVVSRFNGDVTTNLLERALDELEARGVVRDAVTVMPVPGAFELPLAAMALAKTRRFACIVALGCVIRGDTPHFDYVASETASGLQLAGIETGVPVAFGVLTLDRVDQAAQRYEKGAEAVRTALEMADLFSALRAAAAQ